MYDARELKYTLLLPELISGTPPSIIKGQPHDQIHEIVQILLFYITHIMKRPDEMTRWAHDTGEYCIDTIIY